MPKQRAMASRRSRDPAATRAAPAFIERARQRLIRSRARLAVIGLIPALALVVLGLQMNSDPEDSLTVQSPPVQPQAASGNLAADASTEDATATATGESEAPAVETDPDAESAPFDGPAPALPTTPAEQDKRSWEYVQVASGDTLEVIFRRLGLSVRLLHDIVRLDSTTRGLADLRPGDELAFDLDGAAGFRALRAESGDQHWLFVERVDDKLVSRIEERALEVRVAEVEAEITSSLFNAGKNAGLSDNMILRLAGIFGWDIDFALDIRSGDRFALAFEEIYRDGQFLRQGAVLGARFINQGESFAAIRFDAGNGHDYYDPEGRPMRKAFLRAPISFTRVTSNFNPRRLHPVTRQVRPHNGTDYGAPTGTPVWSAGDGSVLEAGYGAANGNYIFIQHGNHIVTRYLHLSKKMVKRGDRVRQGQTIGLVGATGLATGPHLHYEFLVNGRHRDPRKVDLPEAQPLPAELLPEYKAHAGTWLTRLEQLMPPKVMLASSGEGQPAPESRQQTTTAPQ
ncbi:MAG: peptidoglycan DD-metalloendopeptidase family protein [Xanthomonadaceae bacterium]|nr:peptidoglycan DD-metalloendopeptidase family protein [Xanthomonadaceae bacterium]